MLGTRQRVLYPWWLYLMCGSAAGAASEFAARALGQSPSILIDMFLGAGVSLSVALSLPNGRPMWYPMAGLAAYAAAASFPTGTHDIVVAGTPRPGHLVLPMLWAAIGLVVKLSGGKRPPEAVPPLAISQTAHPDDATSIDK